MSAVSRGTAQGLHGLVTNGGRVLGVTALGKDLEQCIRKVYGSINRIYFKGMHYRRDIGRIKEREQ